MEKPIQKLTSAITALVCGFTLIQPAVSYAVDPEYKSWSQMDERWGSKIMGSGDATIAKYGCLATSLAIMAVDSGTVDSDTFNPGTFVDAMNELDAFNYYGSLASWALLEEAVPGLSCEGKFAVPTDMTEQEYVNKIIELNNQEYYMVCYVGNHWVYVDSIEDGVIYMCDPATDETVLFEEYPFDAYTHDTIRYFTGALPPSITDTGAPETPIENTTGKYKVTADVLNVRSEGSTSGEILGTISYGDELQVIEITDGWGKISFDGNFGWVSLDYLTLIKADEVQLIGKYSVTATSLNVRSEGSTSGEILGTVSYEDEVYVTEIVDGWGKISFEDGFGWISLEYAKYIQEETTTTVSETTTTTTTTTTATTTTTTATTMATGTINTVMGSNTIENLGSAIPPREYVVVSESADITKNNKTLMTVSSNYILQVKSIKNGVAEIVYDDDVAYISADAIELVESNNSTISKGDINNDGVINKIDISCINEYIIAESVLPNGISILNTDEIYSADYNNDGVVNSDDVIQLLVLICN